MYCIRLLYVYNNVSNKFGELKLTGRGHHLPLKVEAFWLPQMRKPLAPHISLALELAPTERFVAIGRRSKASENLRRGQRRVSPLKMAHV